MGNNSISYDSERLSSVWQRVTGESSANTASGENTCTPVTDTEQLRQFMTDESSDALYYRTLAGRVCGCESRLFLRIAADECRHLKKLKTSYFILTGESFTPVPETPRIMTVSEALRDRYEHETGGTAAYCAAADKTQRCDLAALYRALSSDEAEHARAVTCVIESRLV